MYKKYLLPIITIIIMQLLIAGCASSKKDIFPQDLKPMKQIYDEHFEQRSGFKKQNMDTVAGNQALHAGNMNLEDYTRDSYNEIQSLFPRVSNPDLLMFVFPHLAGLEKTPVPGYSTTFPMYRNVEYALPGEIDAVTSSGYRIKTEQQLRDALHHQQESNHLIPAKHW